MAWVLSYVGANFALIAVVVLAVIALGAIAWFAKNWKVAVAAILVVCAGLAYQQIDHNAYNRAQAEQKAREVAVLRGRLDTLQAVNDADAARALANAEQIADLQLKAMQTPANDSSCLPEDAAKRVGDVR